MENKSFIQMTGESGEFSATFTAGIPGTLHVAFKDGADNWDNNSAKNYSFEVSEKKQKAAEKKIEVKKPQVKKSSGAKGSS